MINRCVHQCQDTNYKLVHSSSTCTFHLKLKKKRFPMKTNKQNTNIMTTVVESVSLSALSQKATTLSTICRLHVRGQSYNPCRYCVPPVVVWKCPSEIRTSLSSLSGYLRLLCCVTMVTTRMASSTVGAGKEDTMN